MRRLGLALLLVLLASPAHAASANYVHVAVTTNQSTTSSSYSTVPGATITSAALSAAGISAGDKVLLLVQAQAGETSSGLVQLRVTHGATPTAFAESTPLLAVSSSSWRVIYWWGTVWTVVDSEDINLQFAVTAGTGNVDFVSMFALDLSNDLIEGTHWHADFTSSAATTDEALSTTPDDGASITFTPATAGHDWLVMAFTQYDITTTTDTVKSSLIRSGEASSSLPSTTLTVSATSIQPVLAVARVFEDLGAVSQTFKEQSVAGGTAHTRLHSGIFALDLDAFAAHANAYTEGALNLTATDYADAIQTASITPTVTGPVYVGGWWNFNRNNISWQSKSRLQIDDADDPSGQSTAAYLLDPGNGAGNATDEVPIGIQTVASLSNAAHTLDLDGSAEGITDTPTAQYRSLWSFSLELAARSGGVLGRGLGPGVIQ